MRYIVRNINTKNSTSIYNLSEMKLSMHQNTLYALLLLISFLTPAQSITNAAINQDEAMPPDTFTCSGKTGVYICI